MTYTIFQPSQTKRQDLLNSIDNDQRKLATAAVNAKIKLKENNATPRILNPDAKNKIIDSENHPLLAKINKNRGTYGSPKPLP